ncbi:hypothetical protein QTO34_003998 [Cnephaeus nilssonii]|uniref:Large ribosomal subunit protein uL15/eL18 domain-containing protein n=1 Tax=Cnephaeus nilssonii TaxID=3371016 RepID=A0AA40LKD7_CNENI|nr:hypothetical protein QTO34_003998 [Eptesicus nilssonii]
MLVDICHNKEQKGGAQVKVCALHVSSCTRGKILTFSQLALDSHRAVAPPTLWPSKEPRGERHFGKAPGTLHSHSKPYLCSKGQRFECREAHVPATATRTNPPSYFVIKKMSDAEKIYKIKKVNMTAHPKMQVFKGKGSCAFGLGPHPDQE